MSLLGSLSQAVGLSGQALGQTSGLSQASMDKLEADYMKMQLQSHQAHLNAHQQAAQHTYISNPYAQQVPIEPPKAKLDEGAWDVAISQLVDLWVVRYGSTWVTASELDEFYKVAAQRLRTLHKIETHYVNGTDVFRIVE